MKRAVAVVGSVLRLGVSWIFLGLVSLAFAPVLLVLLPSRARRIRVFNLYGHLVGRVMVWFAGASLPAGIAKRLRTHHPAIYLANHTSYLDIFFGIWAAPFGTVGTAKRETILVPFFGQLYAISGHLRVNREDRRSAVATLRDLTETLRRHGFGALLWPEGTRSADGRLQPFKRGFAHLALATRLPIVPIVVSGAHRCWPKGAALTFPARVDVRILDPIATTDWTAARIEDHVTEVWARFAAALPEDQKPLPPP
jgi:1-acyl-sn-glycerol-3-phosphate acyltransferase